MPSPISFGKRDLAWLVLLLAVVLGGHFVRTNNRHDISVPDSLSKPETHREENFHVTPTTSTTGAIETRAISPFCFSLTSFQIHTVPGLKTSTCRKLIQFSEEHNQWTGMSAFGTYQATKDVSIDSLVQYLGPEEVDDVENFIMRLHEFVRDNFMNKLPDLDGKLNYNNVINYDEVIRLKGSPFVIRYDADEVPDVRLHKDNADASFVVLLSAEDDFEGGGTVFEAIGEDDPIFVKQGEALVFAGQLIHGAKPVRKGRRYVLSGFTFFSEEYLKMKRLETMATMVRLE